MTNGFDPDSTCGLSSNNGIESEVRLEKALHTLSLVGKPRARKRVGDPCSDAHWWRE